MIPDASRPYIRPSVALPSGLDVTAQNCFFLSSLHDSKSCTPQPFDFTQSSSMIHSVTIIPSQSVTSVSTIRSRLTGSRNLRSFSFVSITKLSSQLLLLTPRTATANYCILCNLFNFLDLKLQHHITVLYQIATSTLESPFESSTMQNNVLHATATATATPPTPSGSSAGHQVRLEIYASKLPNTAGAFKGTSDPFAIVTVLANNPRDKPHILGKTEV
jgi:hypothetical protein